MGALSVTCYVGQNLIRGFRPDERLWTFVVHLQVLANRRLQFLHAAKDTARYAFVGDFCEPSFHQVDPRTVHQRNRVCPTCAEAVRPRASDIASLPGIRWGENGLFLRLAGRRAGRILAVEFPSPCDGSESGIRPLRLRRLVQVKTTSPTKDCYLYRHSQKTEALYRLRLESPSRRQNTSPHW
jgi:hypothetical protein